MELDNAAAKKFLAVGFHGNSELQALDIARRLGWIYPDGARSSRIDIARDRMRAARAEDRCSPSS